MSLYQDGSEGGIFAQRFDATGAPVGAEFQVNTYTADTQFYPVITNFDDGRFLISWTSQGQDNTSSNYGVYAQLYNADGTPAGADLLASSEPRHRSSRRISACFRQRRNYVSALERSSTGTVSTRGPFHRQGPLHASSVQSCVVL